MRRRSSRLPAIDRDQQNRFAAEWSALWPGSEPVGLAVSGGPDSLALLLLAFAVVPGRFLVATVDHGLRQQGAVEAAFVQGLCAERGVPHKTLTLALAPGAAVQERARAARYEALGEWARRIGLAAIMTAHHADDQAETLLMRLMRGAGVRGLAAMRSRSHVPGYRDVALLRPLLEWRSSELAAIVDDAGISAVVDPSNSDPRFERARIRSNLAAVPWLDAQALASSARHLAEADDAIDWAAHRVFANVELHGGALWWSPKDTPRAVALRVLERILEELGAPRPRGGAVSRWYDRLASGSIATLAGVRGDGRKSPWRFTAAAPHRARSDGPLPSPQGHDFHSARYIAIRPGRPTLEE